MDVDHPGEAHPKAEEKADPNEHLYYPDHVSEEDGMRQNQIGKKRLIETDCSLLNKALQVLLEAAMSEFRPKELVLSKKEEENRSEDAHDRNRLRQGNGDPWHRQRVLRERLLLRFENGQRGVKANLANRV